MKKVISLALSLILFCTLVPFAHAEELEMLDSIPEATSVADSVSTYAEQVEWIYRNNNGVIEKRLWSYTYGKWLTDWIPCD